MAKTDWQMGDTVQPADMNQIGQEINDNTAEIANHKSAAVLDHPDGSVTTEKLADGAVTAAKVAPDVATVTTAQNIADNARKDAAKEIIVEVRTSDPPSPEIGRVWLRSDL